MMNQLLGFDIRVVDWPGAAQWWGKDRRRQYLLRPGVPWIASVDSVVFPSVFEFQQELDRPRGAFPAKPVTPVDLHQQVCGLWRDLGSMQDAFSQLSLPPNTVCVSIAIELRGHSLSEREPLSQVVAEGTNPSGLAENWTLLGYDVADAALVSGLSNCGYSSEDKVTVGQRWSAQINEFGLLNTVDDASAFKEAVDLRVVNHAPFGVFGLYRIGGIP